MAITWKKIAYQDNVDYGLSFECIVTTYTDTTHFKASGLIGKGDAFFKDYYACVVWDNGGIGAAPQGEMVLISAYTSADGTFTHTAFTTPLGVGDKLLIMNPRLLDASYTVDGVYVDSVNGVAGTAYPIGTPTMPVSNLTDALAIAVARRTTTIIIHDHSFSLVTPAGIAGYTLIGRGGWDFIYLNEAIDVSGCTFRDISLAGQTVADSNASVYNCDLGDIRNLSGFFLNCAFYGTFIDPSSTPLVFENCIFRIESAISPVEMTLGLTAYFYNVTGALKINGFATGGRFLNIHGSNLRLTIDASCTAGTINLYGDITLINNSGGTTVNDYRANQKDTRFFQETVAATDVNGTTWKDLLDKSTITSPVRICGFTVTKGGSWAGSAKVRIVNGAGTTKIMPFGTELVETADFTSGEQIILNFPVEVSVSKGYKFQFRSSDAGDGAGETLALTLDVEELS